MLLSELEIRAEVAAGRLVFNPTLPTDRFQSASVDLSLHNTFWRSSLPDGIDGIDITVDIDKADAYKYFTPEQTDVLELSPGEFVLGETAEAFSIPDHLVAWIEGKSGRARHGVIVHCTAPHIAPGWGRQKPKRVTLEIVNHSQTRLRLRAGIPIAQLLIGRLTSPTTSPYSGVHGAKGT